MGRRASGEASAPGATILAGGDRHSSREPRTLGDEAALVLELMKTPRDMASAPEIRGGTPQTAIDTHCGSENAACDTTPHGQAWPYVPNLNLKVQRVGKLDVRHAYRVLDVRTGGAGHRAARLAQMPEGHAEDGRGVHRRSTAPRGGPAEARHRGAHDAARAVRCLPKEMPRTANVGHWTALRSAIAARTASSTPRPRFLAARAVGANHSEFRESRRRACLAAPGVMPTSRANAAGPPNKSMICENE